MFKVAVGVGYFLVDMDKYVVSMPIKHNSCLAHICDVVAIFVLQCEKRDDLMHKKRMHRKSCTLIVQVS